ncbi:amidohydrolase [soil metagenome]
MSQSPRMLLWPAALFLLGAWSGPALGEDLLIRAGRVETMAGPALEPGAVLISEGKITEVGGPDLQLPEGIKVIDLGEQGVLLPGLIDADSKIGIQGPDSEYTREITPEFCLLPALDWKSRAFREALTTGTTSAGLIPGSENVIAGAACVVKTAGGSPSDRTIEPDAGLVIIVASDPAGRNRSRTRPDSIYVRQPTNRMGVVWMLRSSFEQARAGAEELELVRDSSLSADLGPVREALEGSRPMIGLSRTAHDIEALLRLGEEFGFSPILLGGQEAYKVAELLASAQTPVILAPLNPHRLTGPERTDLAWNIAGTLEAAGVTIALSAGGGDLLEQARFANRFGLPRETALRAITANPATLLGVADRVGSIEPGKDADLVAFKGDPLEFTTPIEWVMIDGAIIFENEGN